MSEISQNQKKLANEWVHDLANKMAILQMKTKKVAQKNQDPDLASDVQRIHELVNESIDILKSLRTEVKELMSRVNQS